ncbi:BRCT domain-containing protein [Protomyces lactucae-debilis]|uniref:BRCT domain-containing protein n=1 Tax=Protomyces lactucae-debilis TaxID=2754530 RepID=A0A1Y2EWF9_PROLT|nr:BRCT domain-containing protein [Protomyces lactucae-debilis]ORY75466.1 BRCT domain-containing protein [Protomyces lactucae-debilis]
MACLEGVRVIVDGDALDVSVLREAQANEVEAHDLQDQPNPVYLITKDFHSPLSLTCQQLSHVHLVTPNWVTFSITRKRLQDPKLFSPDPRQFFTGVVICCSELSTGDKEAIYGGVSALGGSYCEHLTKSVTHMAALTLNSEKCQEALNAKVDVVLPHWIDDCLRLRRRVPSEPYAFPDPKILKTNLNDELPRATQDNFTHLKDYSFALDPASLPAEEDVFAGRSIYLADDLELSDRLQTTIATVIANANGKVAATPQNCDIYIGRLREGSAYKYAAANNRIVGNWAWLYYCLAHGKFSSPMKHLLHYPVPTSGLPEFADRIFTISNYTGYARTFLEQLIIRLGGRYTRSMKPDHTHLITAIESGEKYNTAKQWNIECANHLWLEDCYAKWQALPCTLKSYQYWPREIHLMDVVGSTPLEMEGILPFFEDEIQQASELVMPSSKTLDAEESPVLRQMQANTPNRAQLSPPASRHSTARKASTAAATKLRDSMQDANKHALELKRKHPDSATPRKSVKLTSKRLLLTGCPEMSAATEATLTEMGVVIVEHVKDATHLVAPRLARTKKFVTAMPIAHKLKFVNWDWVMDGVKTHKLAKEQLYPMAIPEDQAWAEDFSVASVQAAAKRLQDADGLFAGRLVHISDAAANLGGFGTYREIIAANGGQCTLFGKRHEFQSDKQVMIVLDEKDAALAKWRRERRKSGPGVSWQCFDREWLMQSAMRQEWMSERELK